MSWRAHAWLRLTARRFVNEGPSLLLFLLYLSLPPEARGQIDLSVVVLPKNCDALGQSLFRKVGCVELREHEILGALQFAEAAIGRQPRTGYLIPPWHLQASAQGVKHEENIQVDGYLQEVEGEFDGRRRGRTCCKTAFRWASPVGHRQKWQVLRPPSA